MAKVRVRQKNQITIPLRIAEEANIKPDDMLEIRYTTGVIALMPHGSDEHKRTRSQRPGFGARPIDSTPAVFFDRITHTHMLATSTACGKLLLLFHRSVAWTPAKQQKRRSA